MGIFKNLQGSFSKCRRQAVQRLNLYVKIETEHPGNIAYPVNSGRNSHESINSRLLFNEKINRQMPIKPK